MTLSPIDLSSRDTLAEVLRLEPSLAGLYDFLRAEAK